jgi:phosphotransferase system enzyme I (PtsI)
MQGRAVSRGIAIGTAVCLYGHKRQFLRRSLSHTEVGPEIERFKAALSETIEELENEIARTDQRSHYVVREILESHLLLLKDPSLHDRVINLISQDRINAEAAVQSMTDELISRFRNNEDEHIREKSLDLEDLAERIMAKLGVNAENVKFPRNSVIVASEIRPSNLLEFIESGAIGVISELGGWTSHTSIMARESSVPAVTGMKNTTKSFRNGQKVIVNGFSGEVIIHPSASTLSSYSSIHMQSSNDPGNAISHGSGTVTLDGRPITIRTNTNSIDSYRTAMVHGAHGIGLFRSESLLGKFKRIPDEDEQFREYVAIADAVGEGGIRIRTFDIDSDQFYLGSTTRQRNPALGLRAIRLGISEPDLLATQIKALLRASHGRKVSIVVPMVSGTEEVEFVRHLIDAESLKLNGAGIKIGEPPVGAMIEIPAAFMLADQLTDVCDFFCLGTNDLVQYLLAADRDNDSVSNWFRTLHPAVLRAVKRVIDVAKQHGKPLVVCGEMAGSPFYAPVLIGMGATELSMNPSSISSVRRVITGIAYEESVALFRKLESLRTADDVERAVGAHARANWPHLFAPGFFETEAA